MFDRDNNGTVDRAEFAPMIKSLGLNLSERKLQVFFDSMDDSRDGLLVFEEFIGFLQNIARPITLEEELTEAFRFFQPDSKRAPDADDESGEEVTEGECGDMIAAATGGLEEIDFATFQTFC